MKTSIACIAFDGEKILVAHRNPTGQMGNRWEFPGGKVEAGESDECAIVREFEEEFGVKVKVGEKICETFFVHNDEQVALHAYEIIVPHDGIAKKYALTEHSEYKWAFPAEIPTLSFVDSDMLIYPDVMKWVASKK